MRKKLLLLFLVVLTAVAVTSGGSRSKQVVPFYIASWNSNTRLSTIWKYVAGDQQASPIFTLHNTDLPATALFSQQELLDLIHYWVNPLPGVDPPWGEQFPPRQQIDAIWRFDSTHLLVQTTNDIQDPFGRGADNNESGRFGYHEFSTLDLTHPQQLQRLFTIDYHDRAYENWGKCASSFVYATEVTLNPTLDQLAFVLSPGRDDFCGSRYLTTLIIADYSTSPVRFTRIPSARTPVWSPDGTRLAYLHAQNTGDPFYQGFHYDLSLEVRTIATGQVTVVDTMTDLTSDVWNYPVAWTDNDTLLYKWYPQSILQGDPPQVVKVYQSQRGQITTLPIDPWTALSGLYPVMEHGQSTRFLLRIGSDFNWSMRGAFVLSPQMPFQSYKLMGLLPGDQLYNSRFPDRILFAAQSQDIAASTSVTALDVNFNLITFDTADVLPANEWVFSEFAP